MNSSAKRKRSQIDDSDDEAPALGKQVLPVAHLPDNFTGEPADGLQYLFTVRRDARQLPHVTRVHNPYEILEGPPGPAPVRLPSNSTMAMPSDEWRAAFIRRFNNFCKNSTQPTIRVDILSGSTSRKSLPEKKERDAWWAFISGRPEIEWKPPKTTKTLSARQQRQQKYRRGARGFSEEWTPVDSTPDLRYDYIHPTNVLDNSLPTPSGTPVPSDLEVQESGAGTASSATREPTPSLLRDIDHKYSLHLLMYFTHWINVFLEQPKPRNTQMSETHARWIFALLSRVDAFMSADEMSLLRNLARACIELLKDILKSASATQTPEVEAGEDNRVSERSCWLIIAIVVERWAQRDLWVDTEIMLERLEHR